jgi:predicted ATPase
LRTADVAPGNLPRPVTSFVGRQREVRQLAELVAAHRLVTLTGVGGVGKTRLALQVAGELAGGFVDGVWLVELAPVGDPGSVPDVVATALGITPQAGLTVTAAIAQALSGRQLLVVLDNCEHVLAAAGDLVEAILAAATAVTVLTTSREGLGVAAEQLWPVPSLAVDEGVSSEAVALFVERAGEVRPGFGLDSAADGEAVVDICRRVDGVALAIELAAARMVSMSPQDVCDRLDDRFRLLGGSRRGLERHQTLRNTVRWSYDLLDDDDRLVLGRSAVFAGGFDLDAACQLSGDLLDDYQVMDRLDSLVRKSLVGAEPVGGHVRYTLSETIRQFAEEQLAASGTIDAVRDRHARYYAEQAIAYWDICDSPRQSLALDWVEAEYANLRTAFRWATDHDDLDTAVAIAAHTTFVGVLLLRYESLGWVTEILDAATAADIRQLPRLYSAATFCSQIGQTEAAVDYAHTALVLDSDARYDPLEPGWTCGFAGTANVYAGRMDEALGVTAGLVGQPGVANVIGLWYSLLLLPVMGRADEARALAAEALTASRAYGTPNLVAGVLSAYGRAFAATDPTRALQALREGVVYTRQHRLVFFEALLCREAGGLEAVHGDPGQACALLENAIDLMQRAGDVGNLAVAFADLAVLFHRLQQPEIAATLYGASRRGDIGWVTHLASVVDHLRTLLGDNTFDQCADKGAAMETSDAATYARQQIRLTHPPPIEPPQPLPSDNHQIGRVR